MSKPVSMKNSLASRDKRGKVKTGKRVSSIVDTGLQLIYRRPAAGAGTWSLRDTRTGKTTLRRLGTADDASEPDGVTILSYEQAIAEARRKAQGAPDAPVAGTLTVDAAADRYVKWFKAHRKGVETVESALRVHIRPALGRRLVTTLTAADLKAFLDTVATKAPARRKSKFTGKAKTAPAPETDEAKRQRRSSANRIYNVLRAILNKTFSDDLVASDAAWRKVKAHKGADAPKIRYLTTAEATRLVNATAGDFRALVRGALATGARYGELVSMTVGDFNAETGQVYIKPGKSEHDRFVPLNAEGRALFQGLTTGRTATDLMFRYGDREWRAGDQRRPLLDACKVAAIVPAISFHELRHTYASALARQRIDLLTISKLLGHADTRITARHYAHLCNDTLAAAVATMPRVVEDDATNVAAII